MLTGGQFKENWNGLSVAELFEYVKTSMPRNDAGHLTPGQTANVVAFIFSSNGFPAGQKELSADPAALKAIRVGGINIVAIHSHMTQEQPRILFFHYWGRGPAKKLAEAIQGALLASGLSGVSASAAK